MTLAAKLALLAALFSLLGEGEGRRVGATSLERRALGSRSDRLGRPLSGYLFHSVYPSHIQVIN